MKPWASVLRIAIYAETGFRLYPLGLIAVLILQGISCHHQCPGATRGQPHNCGCHVLRIWTLSDTPARPPAVGDRVHLSPTSLQVGADYAWDDLPLAPGTCGIVIGLDERGLALVFEELKLATAHYYDPAGIVALHSLAGNDGQQSEQFGPDSCADFRVSSWEPCATQFEECIAAVAAHDDVRRTYRSQPPHAVHAAIGVLRDKIEESYSEGRPATWAALPWAEAASRAPCAEFAESLDGAAGTAAADEPPQVNGGTSPDRGIHSEVALPKAQRLSFDDFIAAIDRSFENDE